MYNINCTVFKKKNDSEWLNQLVLLCTKGKQAYTAQCTSYISALQEEFKNKIRPEYDYFFIIMRSV